MRTRRRNATRSFYPQVRHEVGPRVAAWMDAHEVRARGEVERERIRVGERRAPTLGEQGDRVLVGGEEWEIWSVGEWDDYPRARRYQLMGPLPSRHKLWHSYPGAYEITRVQPKPKAKPKAKTKPRAAPSPPGALPAGFDSFGFDAAPPTGPVEIPGFERVSAAWPRGHTLKFGANRPRTYTITDVDMGAKTEQKLPRGTTAVHPEGFMAVRRIANVKPAVTHEGRRHDWAALLISGDSIEVRVDAYLPADASGHVNKGSRLLGTTYVNPPETTTKPKPKAKPKAKTAKAKAEPAAKAKPKRKTVRAAEEAVVYKTWQDAAEAVLGAALPLAALPAPTQKENFDPEGQGDGVGFAPNTDPGMRLWLDEVRTLGIEKVPLQNHVNAARMMILHSRRQVPREVVMGAVYALEAEAAKRGLDMGPKTAKGATRPPRSAYQIVAASPGRQHRAPGDTSTASYEWDGKGIVAIKTPFRRKVAGPTGSKRVVDGGFGRWRVTAKGAGPWGPGPVGYEDKEFYAHIPVTDLVGAAEILAPVEPHLARALRALGPHLEQRAPKHAKAAGKGRHNAKAGQIGDLRWEWKPKEGGVLFRFPYVEAKGRTGQVAAESRKRGIAHVQPTRAYAYLYPVKSLPLLLDQLDEMQVYDEARPVLRKLLPAWEKVAKAGQRPVSVEDQRRAATLVRRFTHLMDGRTREAIHKDMRGVVAKVAKAVTSLDKVQIGAASVDLGAHGSWRLAGLTGPSPVIYLDAPGVDFGRGARRSQINGKWVSRLPLVDASSAARALDQTHPALALSLRIALLQNVDETVCHELDVMADAATIKEINDKETRLKVEKIKAKVDKLLPGRFKLRPYQGVGVAFAKFANYRCLIGDDMGLGKTLQAIGCLLLEPKKLLPALVIAPSSVTVQWAREGFTKFAPKLKVAVYQGKVGGVYGPEIEKVGKPGGPDVFIIGWDSIRLVADRLAGRFQCVIEDEAHRGKNLAAKRTRAARTIAHATPHRLLLTGTPFENRVTEVWPLLNRIDPVKYDDQREFDERMGRGGYRTVLTIDPATGGKIKRKMRERSSGGDAGETRIAAMLELRAQLRCLMIRRLSEQVLTELPEKTREPFFVALKPREKRYLDSVSEPRPLAKWLVSMARWSIATQAAKWRAEAAIHNRHLSPTDAINELLWSRGGLPFQVDGADAAKEEPSTKDQAQAYREGAGEFVRQWGLVAIGALWRLLGRLKAPHAAAWLADYVSRTGRPVVSFTWHKEPMRLIEEHLAEAKKPDGSPFRVARIDGGTNSKLSDKRGAAFQAGKIDVLLCSSKAREGLNLYAADHLLFGELWWVPSMMDQAEGRIHRMGQTRATYMYRMIVAGSIDESILAALEGKTAEIDLVLGSNRFKGGTPSAAKHRVLGPAYKIVKDSARGWESAVPGPDVVAALGRDPSSYPKPAMLVVDDEAEHPSSERSR